MAKLSERCMLTCLHIGIWAGSTTDRSVTEEVTLSHRAEQGAGRYTKQLIGRKFLANINTVAASARRTNDLLTSPWDDGGTRILVNQMYLKYTEEIRLKRVTFEAAVNNFLKAYRDGDYLAEAKQRLGSMFNAAEYPDADALKGKFSFDLELKAVPDNAHLPKWVGISEQETKKITKEIEKRHEQQAQDAMRSVYERLSSVLDRMVNKLREFEPDTVGKGFRDTLVWNIAEVADVVPYLNITDDNNLARLADQMKRELTEHNPEFLRTDANLRKQTADKADRLLAKVKAYLA